MFGGRNYKRNRMKEKLKYYLKANSIIDEIEINKIISCFKLKTYKKNTTILSSGEICSEFYFVNKGCLRTYFLTKQGNEKTRYIAFDCSIVSSFSSFISRQQSFEFIETIEDSELFVMKHRDFYQLVSEIPQWAKYYNSILEMAYLFQNKGIENLVTLSAKQRYDNLLIEKPMYIHKLSNKILASYLNITQETLSRIKSK
jgi:CRP-like cAMP-binding protein